MIQRRNSNQIERNNVNETKKKKSLIIKRQLKVTFSDNEGFIHRGIVPNGRTVNSGQNIEILKFVEK